MFLCNEEQEYPDELQTLVHDVQGLSLLVWTLQTLILPRDMPWDSKEFKTALNAYLQSLKEDPDIKIKIAAIGKLVKIQILKHTGTSNKYI